MIVAYIAGPMTNVEEYNRPLFFRAERFLKKQGYIPLNPAYHPDGLTHEQYMHICLPLVEIADAVFLLPGWEDSKGAWMEYCHARLMNKVIVEFDESDLEVVDA